MLVRPESVLSQVFPNLKAGEAGYKECSLLLWVIGLYLVCLSLMTCPNPHGYWMASFVAAAGFAKLYFIDKIQGPEMHLGLVVASVLISSTAVFFHKKENAKKNA